MATIVKQYQMVNGVPVEVPLGDSGAMPDIVQRVEDLEGKFGADGDLLPDLVPVGDLVDNSTTYTENGIIKAAMSPYNSRVVITESNPAWLSPVTGWARITLIGGGGGGCGGGGDQYTACAGGSGGGGERKVVYVYLTEGSTYACTIGAGGAGGVSNATGNATPVAATLGKAGGVTKFVAGSVTYTAEGGGGAGSFNLFGFGDAGVGGGSGETAGLSGIRGVFNTGVGGSLCNQFPSGAILSGYGSGGLGGAGGNPAGISGIYNAGSGNQGAIIINYYDPKKENA